MKVRYPVIEFSNLRAHWTKVPEFAQLLNSFSTVPAHVEPFLVKVMRKVQKELDPVKDEELLRDIDIFNKQEMQHCKIHLALNRKLYSLGYPEMAELEQPYKEDYERFLTTKSLRFNVAYCEGFEAMGSASAQMYFEDLKDLFEGADREAMDTWFWHLAEEFEHRQVCLDVYKRLFGKGVFSYFYRVGMFLYSTKHIGDHTMKIACYLMQKDREKMSADEVAASKKREKQILKRYRKAMLKKILAVFSPFYDPSAKMPSPGMEEVLASYPDTRQA